MRSPPAPILDCCSTAPEPVCAPGSWPAADRLGHTPQPTPPVTDDDEDDEDEAPGRGSDGGNIDPDHDEGWSDEDDEDDDDSGWSTAGRSPARPLRR